MSNAKSRREIANRLNAQKSTGPRTPEGKARSGRNALKHGLLAAAVVLPPELLKQKYQTSPIPRNLM